MLIVDAHQDLAWNMLSFGRDYTLSAAQIRQAEANSLTPACNDDATLGWPEYQRGRVAVIFATLFVTPQHRRTGFWDTLYYTDANDAHRQYSAQLDVYARLSDDHPDKFRLIHRQDDLRIVLCAWENRQEAQGLNQVPDNAEGDHQPATGNPVGLVMLMEGAEGIRHPDELGTWWQRGLRIIGPAWAGNRFCGGTREPGAMTAEGFELLEGMAEFGFGLDLSHMDEKAALQALETYPGQIMASHSNALALLKGSESNRHLSDRLIHGLVEREGIIGIVPFNAFLQTGWRRSDHREGITCRHVVAQIDYICQLAGDAHHAGIGSDFDGGFGLQCLPSDLDTIADLQKLVPLLSEKGYSDEDIAAIMGRNWLRFLEQILP